jgi:hypothetical protein
MSEKAESVQDVFLTHLREDKTPVTIFLMNGIKLRFCLRKRIRDDGKYLLLQPRVRATVTKLLKRLRGDAGMTSGDHRSSRDPVGGDLLQNFRPTNCFAPGGEPRDAHTFVDDDGDCGIARGCIIRTRPVRLDRIVLQ